MSNAPRGTTTSKNSASKAARSRVDRREQLGRRDANHLIALTAGFMGLGLIMVLSASSVVSTKTYGSPWSLFERQVMWMVIALVAFAIASKIELATWRRLSAPMVFVSGFLLLLVLVHGVGTVSGGSSRWIGFGPINIQPSEFAKLAFVVFAADLSARRAHALNQLESIVRPIVIVLAGLGLLILRQPDMGTAVVLVCITLTVFYSVGVRGRLIATALGIVVVGGLILAMYAPYRRARLLSFLNPFAHASTSGYQIVQGLVALGSGHITGTGIGGSVAAWGLLPNAQTDFIFAIIGNELGLIGACIVLVGFLYFGWLGIRIASRCDDLFSSLLAAGLTCWIVCQALINIGGVLSVLPDTGIPLPFLSFGGSSLVVVFIATAILVKIARNPGNSTMKSTSRKTASREVVRSARGR